jgi:hypothetical protein
MVRVSRAIFHAGAVRKPVNVTGRLKMAARFIFALIRELGDIGQRHRELAAVVHQRMYERGRLASFERPQHFHQIDVRPFVPRSRRVNDHPAAERALSRLVAHDEPIAPEKVDRLFEHDLTEGAFARGNGVRQGAFSRTEKVDFSEALGGPDVQPNLLMILEA